MFNKYTKYSFSMINNLKINNSFDTKSLVSRSLKMLHKNMKKMIVYTKK